MDKIRITFILILTCAIIIGTTCLAATGIVNAPNGLVLREQASKNSIPLTTITDDEKVEIIEKVGDWYKVKYGIYEGYLFAEYVNVQEEITDENENIQELEEQPTENELEENNNNQTTDTTYPKELIVNTNIKGYLIPSITSRVVLNIEQDKKITINYELNNWLYVTYEGKQAWIRKYYININDVTENEEEEQNKEEETTNTDVTIENRKGYINVTSSANVRESASKSANVVTSLLRNAEVTILAENGDFYKIQYQNITGYVSKSLVSDSPVEATSRSNANERKQESTTTESVEVDIEEDNEDEEPEASTSTYSGEGERVAEFAKQYVGYSYVYGGTTPSGFDCTGFAYYVYNSCGIALSRSCSVQASSGTAVSRANLQPGDLVLFNNGGNGTIGHVGIYIGGGNIVHAENSRTGVVISTIDSGYYYKYYYSARRIVD